jgi:hypothetical protein
MISTVYKYTRGYIGDTLIVTSLRFTVDIFLDGPVERDVPHPQLLALVDIQRSALPGRKCGEHFSYTRADDGVAVCQRAIDESTNRARLVVALDEYRIPP